MNTTTTTTTRGDNMTTTEEITAQAGAYVRAVLENAEHDPTAIGQAMKDCAAANAYDDTLNGSDRAVNTLAASMLNDHRSTAILYDAATGELIGPATDEQHAASDAAVHAGLDDGVILIDEDGNVADLSSWYPSGVTETTIRVYTVSA